MSYSFNRNANSPKSLSSVIRKQSFSFATFKTSVSPAPEDSSEIDITIIHFCLKF